MVEPKVKNPTEKWNPRSKMLSKFTFIFPGIRLLDQKKQLVPTASR